MIIYSQDRKRFTECKSCGINTTQRGFDIVSIDRTLLGRYSSEKRAMAILDELCSSLTDNRPVYYMPADYDIAR